MVEVVPEPLLLRRKAEQAVRLALEIDDPRAKEGLLNYATELVEQAKALEVAGAAAPNGGDRARTAHSSKTDA